MINGDYIIFERLTLDHIRDMKHWGIHKSPLFRDYNFIFRSDEERKNFLLQKTLSPLNQYYAIIYINEVIGFLGMKKINFLTKNSTLGLVLNPDLVGMGYGTAVLCKFLDFYFNVKKMKKMELEVAGYNPRARRLYEKMGFKVKKSYLDLYPNKTLDENSPEYKEFQDQFVMEKNKLYNYIYRMELQKEEFKFELCY
ncbi:MAG: GNAT family N-acetyltransferase [Tissierellia bacterium]|jgi:RimJ/RimL family protein N-acetyltransferase|nr:GNAT family N-acetyltransferase [Tissierellia bacterium]